MLRSLNRLLTLKNTSFGTRNLIIPKKTEVDEPDKFVEDPFFSQLVNLMMRDGKKQLAKRHLRTAFSIVGTKLNGDPHHASKKVIESACPVVGVTNLMRGRRKLPVPKALTDRQSKRLGFTWIIEASKKRSERSFGERIAGEILAISQGSSLVLQKKKDLYRIALSGKNMLRSTKK